MGGEGEGMDDVGGADGEGLGAVKGWVGMEGVRCEGVEEREG